MPTKVSVSAARVTRSKNLGVSSLGSAVMEMMCPLALTSIWIGTGPLKPRMSLPVSMVLTMKECGRLSSEFSVSIVCLRSVFAVSGFDVDALSAVGLCAAVGVPSFFACWV